MVTTLREIIEEHPVRHSVCRVIIGGAALPKWTSVSYQFSIGQVPTATITVPNLRSLPLSVVEEASVEIWFGFRSGISVLEQLVFGGAVVDSVGSNGHEIVIDCVMDGPRKLVYSYNRRISYDFTAVLAETAVTDLLDLAGVANYFVSLDPWVMGTAAPQTIEFSTYGEAINKIAEVDGSDWYALPTGMVRVEDRSAIPADNPRRIYFSNILTGAVESQPTAITNVDAKPRIMDISRRKFRAEVANFITVDGAVIVTFGPNGEQNSNQITEQVDGASGQFPNGAYWIPTPPLFQDFTFQNELIDTDAKAFEVAERYFDLKNRLFEQTPLTIPGDPDVFLGETVKVIDRNYSGVNSLYFVKGYVTTINETGCSTELDLTGGPESGTYGFASPFAEFYWKYQALHKIIPGGIDNWSDQDLGPGTDEGAKLCEDVPGDTGTIDSGVTWGPGTDVRTVLIGLDGTASQDFDGEIVSWDWYWNNPLGGLTSILELPNGDDLTYNSQLTGPRITLVIDPDTISQIEVTLIVTDDTGRKGFITKTIYTSADHIDAPGGSDEFINDTPLGGGTVAGPCSGPPPGTPPGTGIPPQEGGNGENPPGACSGVGTYYFLAAGPYAMGTDDNRTWHDLAKASAGASGDFISVGSAVIYRTQKVYAIFGTDQGEVVISNDLCQTGTVVFTVPGNPRIECIHFDTQKMGVSAEGTNLGTEGTTTNTDGLVVYTQGSPGTLTTQQAYQQCLAVGFDTTPACIAVAIMIGESGLNSAATASNIGPPASTDRGIAQINSYYHPEVTDSCAYATDCAIRAMFRISSGGTDFTPWSVYTGGNYKTHLSAVQEAVGVSGQIGDTTTGTTTFTPRSFKVWLSTSDGRLYVSNDSGRNWTLWSTLPGGFPIYQILTPGALVLGDALRIWCFGGDTSDQSTLLRIVSDVSGSSFVSDYFQGDIGNAIIAAGPGFSLKSAALNDTALAIMFTGGVDPIVWFNGDPISSPDAWLAAVGTPATGTTIAPGFDGEQVVA